MSYNNYVDADAALRAAYDLETPAVAIIKHANPCGIATADTIAAAHVAAHACDPVSAYGGVIAANRPITQEAAESIAPIFTEVVVAPGVRAGGARDPAGEEEPAPAAAARRLRSRGDRAAADLGRPADPDGRRRSSSRALQWKLVAGEAADAATLADLEFAWRACRSVKSNAILLAHDGASVGVGMGQVNRVDSCKLAVERAGDRAAGSVAASDAFFPFADGAQILIDAGVRRDRAAGRLDPRRRGHRRGRRLPASPCTSPGSGTSSTELVGAPPLLRRARGSATYAPPRFH